MGRLLEEGGGGCSCTWVSSMHRCAARNSAKLIAGLHRVLVPLLPKTLLLPENVPCPLPSGGFRGRVPGLILEGHLYRAWVSRLSFAVSPALCSGLVLLHAVRMTWRSFPCFRCRGSLREYLCRESWV